MRRGAKRTAQCILNQAITSWSRIGATGKAKHLSEKHEWLLRTGNISRVSDAGCQTVDSLLSVPTRAPEPDPTAINPHLEDERKREWLEQSQDSGDQGDLDVSSVGLGE